MRLILKTHARWYPAPPRAYWTCARLVFKMARRMWKRLTLEKNMLRGGWSGVSGAELMTMVDAQKTDFFESLRVGSATWPWDEAADLANLSAMLADVVDIP